MKYINALLYQLYWWEVDMWGKRDVINWVVLFIFQYLGVFFMALSIALCKYNTLYFNNFDYKINAIIVCTGALIFTAAICIYLLRRKRYRKIFTNHDEYDTSWARSVFRLFIISFFFFLSLWWIIPTSMSK